MFKTRNDDTLAAGKRFIARIKKGTIKKRVLCNTAPDYPLAKTAASFNHFINSDRFKPLVGAARK